MGGGQEAGRGVAKTGLRLLLGCALEVQVLLLLSVAGPPLKELNQRRDTLPRGLAHTHTSMVGRVSLLCCSRGARGLANGPIAPSPSRRLMLACEEGCAYAEPLCSQSVRILAHPLRRSSAASHDDNNKMAMMAMICLDRSPVLPCLGHHTLPRTSLIDRASLSPRAWREMELVTVASPRMRGTRVLISFLIPFAAAIRCAHTCQRCTALPYRVQSSAHQQAVYPHLTSYFADQFTTSTYASSGNALACVRASNNLADRRRPPPTRNAPIRLPMQLPDQAHSFRVAEVLATHFSLLVLVRDVSCGVGSAMTWYSPPVHAATAAHMEATNVHTRWFHSSDWWLIDVCLSGEYSILSVG